MKIGGRERGDDGAKGKGRDDDEAVEEEDVAEEDDDFEAKIDGRWRKSRGRGTEWGDDVAAICEWTEKPRGGESRETLTRKRKWERKGLTNGHQLGKLKALEKLNLSHISLTGSISPVFAQMISLTSIDLSYNVLEGSLPDYRAFQLAPLEASAGIKGLCGNFEGNQLQTLRDPSIFAGIFILCGPPLTVKFSGDEIGEIPAVDGDEEVEDRYEEMWVYVAIVSGHVVGFSGILGVLTCKKSWRIAFQRFVDEMIDRLWVFAATKRQIALHGDDKETKK